MANRYVGLEFIAGFMMAPNPTHHRGLGTGARRRLGGILIAGCTFVMAMHFLGAFVFFDNRAYDLFFRLRGAQDPDTRIQIIAVDEKTLARLGRWPIDRRYFAQLLDRLKGAAAVGVDIIWAEPGPPISDQALQDALQAHGRVIMPVYLSFEGQHRPLKRFSQFGLLGHVHLEPDMDGIVRKLFRHIQWNGELLTALSQQIVSLGQADGTHPSTVGKSAGDGSLSNILQSWPHRINYYGANGAIPRVSMIDVLEGRIPETFFEDKFCLVGITATGIEAGILTPFTQERKAMAGVEVHAHAVANLLKQELLQDAFPGLSWIVAGILVMGCWAAFRRWTGWLGIVIWSGGLALIMGFSFLLFSIWDIWMPVGVGVGIMGLSACMAYFYRIERYQADLRGAKQDWEKAFDAIRDAIVIHDGKGRLLRANRTAQVHGAALMDLFRSRQQKRASETGPPDVKTMMSDIRPIERQGHYYEISAHPMTNEPTGQSALLQVARDVTHRVHSDAQQEQLRDQLIRAQKMEALATLAGGIAHDFRNILTVIMGFTELAKFELKQQPQTAEKLEQALTGCMRAKDLIDQILSFSRQNQPQQQTFRPALIINEALKLLESTLPKSIHLDCRLTGRGFIVGDPTHIHQVIMNLCTNAFHAMMPQGGKLTIALEDITVESASLLNMKVLPGAYVHLTVADSGTGMDPATLKNIFKPYFTTKKENQGTGLGLAVTQSIVKRLGGAIIASSELGRGTLFEIYLPRVAGQDACPLPKSAEMPTGHEKILIVDDEVSIVAIQKTLLEGLGYQVQAFSSSVEALDRFQRQPNDFDLLITDLNMPGITGAMLINKVRIERADLPIILCTGYSEELIEKEMQQDKVNAIIMKPVENAEMAMLIRNVLKGRST